MPPDASAPPTLEKTLPESVPDIPPWITPISDVLVVKSSLEDPVEIRFPIGQLPAGVSLDDVNLYAYIKVSDAGEASWFPVAMEHSFEGTEESPVLLVSLGGLQGLAVLGYHRTSPAIPFEPGSSSNNQRVARSETSRTEPPRGCGRPTKLKPRWDVHLRSDEDWLRRHGEALPPVLGGTVRCRRLTSSICGFHLGFSLVVRNLCNDGW